MTQPFTTPDVLPYEALRAGEPTETLNGGTAGDSDRILAIQVQRVVTELRSDIQDASDAANRGWTPVATSTADNASSFVVDATAGGLFPAGTFQRFRFGLYGSLSEASWITMNINNSLDDGSHNRGWLVWNAAGTLVEDGHGDATTWRIGRWSTTSTNSLEAVLLDTGQTSLISYRSESCRTATAASNHQRGFFWGNLIGAPGRLLSSLRIGTATPSSATITGRWWLEGYRP